MALPFLLYVCRQLYRLAPLPPALRGLGRYHPPQRAIHNPALYNHFQCVFISGARGLWINIPPAQQQYIACNEHNKGPVNRKTETLVLAELYP